MYDRLVTFDKLDFPNDPYSRYGGSPHPSQNLDLLRKELQLKSAMTIDYGVKDRLYQEELSTYKNQKGLSAKYGLGMQMDFDPKNYLKQLPKDPLRQTTFLDRDFGRDINRQFGKERNQDDLKDFGKGYGLGVGKDLFEKDMGSDYSKYGLNKNFKDYSALLGK